MTWSTLDFGLVCEGRKVIILHWLLDIVNKCLGEKTRVHMHCMRVKQFLLGVSQTRPPRPLDLPMPLDLLTLSEIRYQSPFA